MRLPDELPSALGTAFSTQAALDAGVLKGRLRRSDLAHPFRSVHTRGAPAGLDEFCRAYLQRAGEDEFFTHATAARIWGLPLPIALERRATLDVGVRLPAHPPQAVGVLGHRIQRRIRVVRLRGLPVVAPVECWIELARLLTIEELVEVGDALVCRVAPLATLEELFRTVSLAKGVRGVGRLRRAVGAVRVGTDSPAETRLRLILVAAGLPEPVVGHAIMAGSRLVGTPDLAYLRERLALEYEGDIHRTDRRTFRRDIERKETFHDARWHVMRVTADHLRDPENLVGRVRRRLAERS